MERRFHNPYRYWASGFGFELLVFSAFVGLVALIALVAKWIFG